MFRTEHIRKGGIKRRSKFPVVLKLSQSQITTAIETKPEFKLLELAAGARIQLLQTS
jgi:hypothetical protein